MVHEILQGRILEWVAFSFFRGYSQPRDRNQVSHISPGLSLKKLESCPTLCNPVDCSPPRSSVHGIFQARVLEWVSISFSRGSSQPRDRTQVSCIVSKTLYCLSHQGRVLLSKSLIQFSIDGWSCVPSLLFTWGQTMVEVMKIMVISIKRPHACTATVRAPNPAAGPHRPTPSPETPRHPQASPGQTPVGSLFPSPGSWCTRFCCALQESIFQSCVSSGSSMVGLMATSSKRAYAIPTRRASVPAVDHCRPIPPQEMLKHSSVSVSVGFLGPGVHKVRLSPLSISGGNGV